MAFNRIQFHALRNFLLAIAMVFLSAGSLFAQDVKVTAEVDSTSTYLGSPVQLTLTVEGLQNVSAFELPPIEGFDASYIGPSRQMTIVNGKYSSKVSFNYSLMPQQVGTLAVPPFNIELRGEKYSTQAIAIDVRASNQEAANPEQKAFKTLNEKILLNMSMNKSSAYLYEPLSLMIRLFYTTDINLRINQLPEFVANGFMVEEYSQPKEYSQLINGVRFNVVEFKTIVYPTRTGDLTIGAAKVPGDILIDRGNADDGFFGSFFRRTERRPVKLTSNELSIAVNDLPEKGKPADFSGAVGQFDFDVTVSPNEVQVGDPITLKMKISGRGNLKTVQFPSLEGINDYKQYEPIISEEEAGKLLEQVIIPTNSEVNEVPAIYFNYFDVAKGQYATVNQGPFPITVSESNEEEFKIVGESVSSRIDEPEVFGRDIVFIKDQMGTIQRRGRTLANNPLFYLAVIIAYALLGFLYLRVNEEQRIKTDVRYAKRLQAPKSARKGLSHAKQLIEANKQIESYDALFKTLQLYFVNKLHISSGLVSVEGVRKELPSALRGDPILEKLKQILDRCDQVRYASTQLTQQEMVDSYQNVVKIIDFFERNVS